MTLVEFGKGGHCVEKMPILTKYKITKSSANVKHYFCEERPLDIYVLTKGTKNCANRKLPDMFMRRMVWYGMLPWKNKHDPVKHHGWLTNSVCLVLFAICTVFILRPADDPYFISDSEEKIPLAGKGDLSASKEAPICHSGEPPAATKNLLQALKIQDFFSLARILRCARNGMER